LTQGLKRANQDGRFKQNFRSLLAIADILQTAQSRFPKAFSLENPLVSAQVKAIPDKYWHKS